MDSSQIFSVCLVTFGVGLLAWHVIDWLSERSDPSETQRGFARRQFARRMQASTLIVMLGISVWVGRWVPDGIEAICFWMAMLLLVFWIGVLALADVIAIQYHYRNEEAAQRVEQAQLEQLARRLQNREANGRAADAESLPGDESLS